MPADAGVGGCLWASPEAGVAAAYLNSSLGGDEAYQIERRLLRPVWLLILSTVVLVTGLWMIGRVAKDSVQAGLSFAMPLDWMIMSVLGLVMMAIFGHIRFALFKRLQRAVVASDWPAGGKALAGIRTWVGINLGLGVLTVAVALLG